VPDFAGQRAGQRLSLGHVFCRPGVRPVLTVVMLWIMAHYMLYTYIAAFLASVGLDGQVEQALLAFGIAALVGIWLTGLLIDRWLRRLVLLSLAGFALVSLTLALGGLPAIAVYLAMAAWGLSYSGAPTLLQTALANAAADGADVAQSMLVTVLNLAFAGSAVVGGVLLETTGVGSIPWATLGLVLLAWLVVKVGGQAGFRSLSKP
ncbi:MAG: MFS transporter, partial [Pseudomonas sp.]